MREIWTGRRTEEAETEPGASDPERPRSVIVLHPKQPRIWVPRPSETNPVLLTNEKVRLPAYDTFWGKEFLPYARRTRRFYDFAHHPEELGFLGWNLAQHAVGLRDQASQDARRENIRRQQAGEELLDVNLVGLVASLEDLDEVNRERPTQDEPTNGKTEASRTQALANFERNVALAGDPALEEILHAFIGPLVRKVPRSELPPEARLMLVSDARQLLEWTALAPFRELERGHQRTRFQRELAFDVALHRAERLLDATTNPEAEFPALARWLDEDGPDLERLIERLHTNEATVAEITRTLVGLNPNRIYQTPAAIVEHMTGVLERLIAYRQGRAKPKTTELAPDRWYQIRSA